MNAVIGLCNFCELHGPSVLFCTQAFHDMENLSISCYGKSKQETNQPKKRWYGPNYSKDHLGKSGTECTIVPPLKKDSCEGCTSMNVKCRGYISNDHEARISYVSSQYPLHSEIFSIVRQACVRSLSCEVCPGREGPIFYGDNHRGHVLSHTFFLKDSQARGFQSWYSIIIVMTDKIFLLNSWQFLVKHFQKIIHELQEKAFKVYSSEQSENNQRAVRLNSVTRMTLDTFRRQRGNVKARSIIDLTSDRNVFRWLHSWFTWVLKAGACRIHEKVIEGFPNEETMVDLERQEEIEDGFIKIHIKRIESENSSILHITCNEKASPEPENTNGNVKFKSIRHLYQVLGYEKFHSLAYHTVVGNQIIIKSKCLSLMQSIIKCLKVLLPRGCFHPIYYSVSYEDSWKCNFLGIIPEVNIPDHVKTSELHVQIDATKKENCKEATTVNDFEIVISSTAQIPNTTPQVLAEMERVIADETFPQAAFDVFLFTQKEIWMNKVKVLFAFSRAKSRTVEETAQLFNVLKAQDYDKQVLKFWMTGLSTEFKTQILSSVVQGKPEP